MNQIIFTAKQAATDLWSYGEDQYVDRALNLKDKELIKLHELAYYYDLNENPSTLPPDRSIGQTIALTLVKYFENGNARPLIRKRRRSIKLLPEYLHYSIEEEFDKQMSFMPKSPK